MKLSRLTIPYNALKSSSYLFFFLVFSGSFSLSKLSLQSLAVISVVIAILLTASFVWSFLVWKNYSYWVDKDTLRIKQGVIRKKNRRIPKKRVQNIDIKRNVVQRALGISEIKLETAGGGKTEATLAYLDLEEARELRENLKQEEETEKEENETEEPIYEISDKELALLSLTSVNFGKVFSILFIFGVVPTILGRFLNEANLGLTVGTPIILVVLAVFTLVSSSVSTFLQYWGFKLYKNDDNLQYERGLLNRSEGSIPLKKIQRVTLEENFLKRVIGYSSLNIDTAGYSPSESIEKGSEAAIPMAKRGLSMDLANQIADIQEPDLKNIGENAKYRYLARYILSSSIIFGLSIIISISNQMVLLTGFLLLALSFTASKLKWKNKGFSSGKEHCITVNGFWKRKTNFIPYFRIQNIIGTQSILQKRLGLANIDIDTAGTGNILNRTVAVDLEANEAEEFREKIFEKFKESLK